jgi:hypothetical protein
LIGVDLQTIPNDSEAANKVGGKFSGNAPGFLVTKIVDQRAPRCWRELRTNVASLKLRGALMTLMTNPQKQTWGRDRQPGERFDRIDHELGIIKALVALTFVLMLLVLLRLLLP